MRSSLKQVKRVVVKAGTSILTSEKGSISQSHLERLGKEILQLIEQKREAVLVSSGAIAFGMEASGLKQRPKKMERLQACAAIGQGKLMHAYEQFFSKYELTTAQLLLTRDGLEMRKRFLEARHTLQELFKMKTLAIVNENDTVSTDEIAFGDNDILSVHVAHLIHADLLILLSDVDGFFLQDGSRIRQVEHASEIDAELIRHLKDTKKERTVGGMRAKLQAARLAMKLGVALVIVNGHEAGIIEKLLSGEDVGTLFMAERHQKSAREKWIAFSAPRKGTVVVDQGAFNALHQKKCSLLPSGITEVRGTFDSESVVELEGPDGTVFGRGVVRYSNRDLKKIMRKKTSEIKKILGFQGRDEVIHRNDLVLWI